MYSKIVDYFRDVVAQSSEFTQTIGGQISIIESDMEGFSAAENSKLRFPVLCIGFNSSGIDSFLGSVVKSGALPTRRTYNVTLALYKEVPKINNASSTAETLVALDQMANELIKKMLLDQENCQQNCTCKVLQNLIPEFRLYRAPMLGDRKAMGIVISCVFNINL